MQILQSEVQNFQAMETAEKVDGVTTDLSGKLEKVEESIDTKLTAQEEQLKEQKQTISKEVLLLDKQELHV